MHRLPQNDESLDKLIDNDAIDELYRRIPAVVYGTILLSTALAIGISSYHQGVDLVLWLITMYVSCGHRYYLFKLYTSENRPAVNTPDYWGNRYAIGSLILGAMWGFGGVYFFSSDAGMGHQVALFCIIIGVTISGVNNNSVWPKTYLFFVTSSIGPLSLRMLFEGTSEYAAMGIGLLIYIVVAYNISKGANRSYRKTVALNYTNLELLKALQKEKERVEFANQAKTRFLASASHDLRQPVHSLSLFTTALESEVKSANGKLILTYVNSAVDSLNQLLTSLLDISKLDANIIEPEKEIINIRSLLESITLEFAPLAQEKGLKLKHHLFNAWVNTDPTLLSNIVRNLLSNAIRYTSKGGVLIGCRRRGDKLILQVLDTGIGIDKSDQELIFLEFQQLHNPERDRSKGLGLGLSICRRMAELLQHPLSINSIKGKGTCFSIELELFSESDCTQPKPGHQPVIWDLKDKHIVVIDDELSVRQGTESLLMRWGCVPYLSDSIESAVQLVKEMDVIPDAIIADYRLRNNTTGAEAITKIHKIIGAEVPAVLVTGDTDPKRIQEANESGFVLLHKPVRPAHLRNTLGKLLNQPVH